MLSAIGVTCLDDLFEMIPSEFRLQGELNLPPALSEIELDRQLNRLSSEFVTRSGRICFRGGGAYDHFIPATIDEICGRGEFYTAYTPYQAEASQGTLQAFFEFQSLVAELTGMDVANASLYEGASALAEAAIMAMRCTGRKDRVIVSGTIHPEYLATLQTYLKCLSCEVEVIDAVDGVTDWQSVGNRIDKKTAAVIVQHPNFFGNLEDVRTAVDQAHQAGALAIEVFDPVSLGVLKRPGDYGFDIAVAEGQSLGIPLQFGGPYLGLLACREEFVRKMPGRLIGQTTDREGRRAFVLNFQTREQHIRRDKATSNICTNQGLMALRAAVYMSQLGPSGFLELGTDCCRKANYLAQKLVQSGAGQLTFPHPIFKEFAFTFYEPLDVILERTRQAGFDLGPDLSRFTFPCPVPEQTLLIAVTEKRSVDEIDQLVSAIKPE